MARPPATPPTRRAAVTALLAGIATTVVAAAREAPPRPADGVGPDAELLAACAAFDALEQQILSLFHGADRIVDDNERDEAIEPIDEQMWPHLERICTLRATTMAGVVARARTLLLWLPDLGDPDEPGSCRWDKRMTSALVRDLARMA